MITAALAAALLLGTSMPPAGQAGRLPARQTIAVEVGETAVAREGLLGTLLPVEPDDASAAESGVVAALQAKPWVEVVRIEGDVAVAVTRCRRTRGSRRLSKDGKSVSIEFKYLVSGAVAVAGARETLDAEVAATRTYPVGRSRQEPTDREDRSAFQRAGKDLGSKICAWILPRIASLRPGGPDAGFNHEVMHKWLVRGDGLEVTGVAAGGPADRAGLQVGDRIRRIDNEDGTGEMNERVLTWRLEPPGTRVRLEIERNRQRQTIELTLAAPRSGEGR